MGGADWRISLDGMREVSLTELAHAMWAEGLTGWTLGGRRANWAAAVGQVAGESSMRRGLRDLADAEFAWATRAYRRLDEVHAPPHCRSSAAVSARRLVLGDPDVVGPGTLARVAGRSPWARRQDSRRSSRAGPKGHVCVPCCAVGPARGTVVIAPLAKVRLVTLRSGLGGGEVGSASRMRAPRVTCGAATLAGARAVMVPGIAVS